MRAEDMKIAVIGAGAIGGVAAALIKRRGYDVEIVCKHETLAKKIETEGLHIFGAKGDHRAVLPAVAAIEDLSGPKDLILLATKANDASDAAERLLPFLNKDSMVVSLQNGMAVEALAAVLGRERTIGCAIRWSATTHSPGEIEATSKGEFVIGNIDNRPDGRLEEVKRVLESVNRTVISDNITGNLFAKLIINSCITTVGLVSGMGMGGMLSDDRIRNTYSEVMREGLAVAAAMGIKAEIHGGKIDFDKFFNGTSLVDRVTRGLLIRLISFKYRRFRSSSLQSFERGRPTEIDYLNGYITGKGRERAIPTPVNDKLVAFVKDIEAGRRRVGPANFEDPVFHARRPEKR